MHRSWRSVRRLEAVKRGESNGTQDCNESVLGVPFTGSLTNGPVSLYVAFLDAAENPNVFSASPTRRGLVWPQWRSARLSPQFPSAAESDTNRSGSGVPTSPSPPSGSTRSQGLMREKIGDLPSGPTSHIAKSERGKSGCSDLPQPV
jgi:hypothetical protein